MNTDNDIGTNETAISVEVGSEVIGKVRSGEISHISLQLNEDNQNLLLESDEDNLVLVIDEMPKTCHGCYLYNGGEFPYAIKDSLAFLFLDGGEDHCLTRIIGVEVDPVIRFNYQGPGMPIVDDPDGDSCIWNIHMEVVPITEESRTYLMRWNPSVSSFTEKDYKECVESMVHGMFRMSWSIREWEEARRGDLFFMMRTGDEKAGIVFTGQFITDPYPGDDWAGSTKRRMYVDMICANAVEPGAMPRNTADKLQKAIPEFDWAEGHSGVLLPEAVKEKLLDLLEA